MSDYLGNLVTRTLSQAGIVRPQLPSLFEPSVANGEIRSELEFKKETFSGPTPGTDATAAAAPAPPSILAPPQSAVGEPEPITSQVSLPKGIPRAIEESTPAPEETVQRPASKSRESRPAAVRAETKVEPVTPELRRNDSRAGQRERRSPRAQASEAPTSVSQLSSPDSQPKSPSLVRPVATLQKIRAVEAVVPAIQSLPQFPPPSAPASTPTINVTIGRVEIRATSPAPSPPRARPKAANVLSLEDYLRQRAKGGGR